jgi:hypothetical protein
MKSRVDALQDVLENKAVSDETTKPPKTLSDSNKKS